MSRRPSVHVWLPPTKSMYLRNYKFFFLLYYHHQILHHFVTLPIIVSPTPFFNAALWSFQETCTECSCGVQRQTNTSGVCCFIMIIITIIALYKVLPAVCLSVCMMIISAAHHHHQQDHHHHHLLLNGPLEPLKENATRKQWVCVLKSTNRMYVTFAMRRRKRTCNNA